MKTLLTLLAILCTVLPAHAQNRLAVLGSSTAAGVGPTSPDSSWVSRVNRYYKSGLGVLDTVYNLAVSGTTVYRGMPSGYTAPAGRPQPDAAKNITRAKTLLSGTAANGVVIVNFPTNGYDTYSIAEIMARLQTIYDEAVANGHRCYITTTQPRSDNAFGTAAVKAKLAALKDSIINRFGVARTLNFWDGMYNPADSSILSAYSAGDNVHLNNAGHRELFNRIVAKNIFALAVPATGDYRSNVAPTGLWSDPASWEVYNGSSWVAAVSAPDSTSGAVRIVAGDSLRISSSVSLDQVSVDSGGVVAMFNTAGAITVTLANAPGEDLTVAGRLYVSAGTTLSGGGTVNIAPVGLLVLRNQGVVNVNVINEGTTRVTGTGNVSGRTFYNNGTLQLPEFTLNLNNGAVLFNQDSVVINATADAFFASSSGTGAFVNGPGAVLYKSVASGLGFFSANVAFSNAGTVKGIGQFVFQNVTGNTGRLAPGNSPGILMVNPAFLTGRAATLQMEVSATGGVAGTHYDQVQLTTVNSATTNVSGNSLRVIDAANDPAGTVYTLVTSAGTITGTFASVTLPANFGNLTYNPASITVEKLSNTPLALHWLDFTAVGVPGAARLSWRTALAADGGVFVVERSEDGRTFVPAGAVAARSDAQQYFYDDAWLDGSTTRYYRLQVVPAAGQPAFSAVRSLRRATAVTVTASPNPAGEQLELAVSGGDIMASLVNALGQECKRWELAAGLHQLSLLDLVPGLYRLSIREAGNVVQVLSITHR